MVVPEKLLDLIFDQIPSNKLITRTLYWCTLKKINLKRKFQNEKEKEKGVNPEACHS